MGRIRRWTRLGIAAGLAAVLLFPATALAGRPYVLQMSGANEFNGSGAPINPHGDDDSGLGVLTLNPGTGQVCWQFGELTLTAGEALPHIAHIHIAPEGVAGPVVIDLFGGGNAPAAPTAYPTDVTCTSASRAAILAVIKDPSAYYVNLHNAQHPGGVMRAQLSN